MSLIEPDRYGFVFWISLITYVFILRTRSLKPTLWSPCRDFGKQWSRACDISRPRTVPKSEPCFWNIGRRWKQKEVAKRAPRLSLRDNQNVSRRDGQSQEKMAKILMRSLWITSSQMI